MIILNKMASQNPLTSNPLKKELVRRIIIAFITKVKSPKVKTIRGIEIKTSMGLINALRRLMIIAAKMASLAESI